MKNFVEHALLHWIKNGFRYNSKFPGAFLCLHYQKVGRKIDDNLSQGQYWNAKFEINLKKVAIKIMCAEQLKLIFFKW